jgi:hypothetical protein
MTREGIALGLPRMIHLVVFPSFQLSVQGYDTNYSELITGNEHRAVQTGEDMYKQLQME